MVNTPISANQVIDVPIELNCLEVPCKTLPNVLQAIVDKLCVAAPDLSTLDFRCVVPTTAPVDLLGVLQGIINVLPCDVDPVPPTSNDGVITGLTGCTPDSWDCSDADACISLANVCNPGVVTVSVVLQALLNRNVSYGNAIKLLCAQVAALQSQISTLQLQVTTIQTTCCP